MAKTTTKMASRRSAMASEKGHEADEVSSRVRVSKGNKPIHDLGQKKNPHYRKNKKALVALVALVIAGPTDGSRAVPYRRSKTDS